MVSNRNSFPFIIKIPSDQKDIEAYLVNHFFEKKPWLEEILKNSGAILFRGNKIELNSYNNFLERLNFEFTSYVGGDSPRTKLNQRIYTSTEYPADQSIVLHNELSFSNTYPKYLFFYCEVSPDEGGETPLADTRRLYNLLPKKLIQKYKKKKLKYTMNLHEGYGLGKSWQQVFETDNKIIVENILRHRKINFSWQENRMLRLYEIVQPIVTHPLTDELMFISQAHQWHSSNLNKESRESLLKLMPEEEFYHYVSHADDEPLNIEDLELTKKIINEIKVVFKWKQGDILFIDNLLTMHGRNSYEGSRRILLSMANNWL